MVLKNVSPEDVVVLVYSVELQLKACQREVEHDLQCVVQHPRPEAGEVLAARLHLQQQGVQEGIYLVCLGMGGGHTHMYIGIYTQIHTCI